MISNAIRRAHNEHVVYFLLTSYLAARDGDGQGAAIPEDVTRLPLAGKPDVRRRLVELGSWRATQAAGDAPVPRVFSETLDVLSAASERIESLERAPRRWNVVERTQGGHERRRRLGWRMNAREAAEWSAARGVELEQVEEGSSSAAQQTDGQRP